MTDTNQDETVKAKIITLLKKGYSRSQLIHDFGFAERTVDDAIKTYKENAGDTGDTHEGGAAGDDSKGSSGTEGASAREGILPIRKEKESVLPEWIASDVAEIFDGEMRDRKIFLAGISVPLMGLRLFTEGLKPFIDLLTVWQAGQAQANEASRGRVGEAAHLAAEEAAERVGEEIQEALAKQRGVASTNPMAATMMQTFQPILATLLGKTLSGLTGINSPEQPSVTQSQLTSLTPPGWTRKKE
jgi:hypothetical protein